PAFLSGLMPVVWFMAKAWAILFIFIWIRASLPRMRYDQLMSFGWKRLIPASLVWLVASTVAVAVRRFGLPWA
ncbi:MAG: NADH-quinone oxidoreductase subunit H, partial [Acidimicrobiia bacterium]